MTERIPCINPRCRRTFKPDGNSGEIICGKCFKTLPEETRKVHRGYWREIRKWDRRISRNGDEFKIRRMRQIRDRYSNLLNFHWDENIKGFFLAPEKPDGLVGFFEDMGWK